MAGVAVLTAMLGLAERVVAVTPAPPDEIPFTQVKAIIVRSCSACHFANSNVPLAHGTLPLDDLISAEAPSLRASAAWRKIYSRVVVDTSMPPEDSGIEMPADDRVLIKSWIDRHFGSPRPAPGEARPGRTPLRRLTRYEYDRSIRDLFGFDFNVSGYLQQDSTNNGFANNSAVAFMTADRISQYLAASKFVAETALGLNDFLTFKRRAWSAPQILAVNPNETFRNRFKTFLADFRNHVKRGQRAKKSPRIHLRVVKDSSGRKHQALDLRNRSQVVLQYDFPVTADYVMNVLASPKRLQGDAELTVTVDGNPVPVRIDASKAVTGYTVPIQIPKGKRSIEISVPSKGNVLLTSFEIAGPMIADRPIADQKGFFSSTVPCIDAPASDSASAQACADKTIRYLASKAFRRSSVDSAEVQTLLAPFQRAIEKGKDFRSALSLSIQAVLLSPRFLYRLEFDTPDTGATGQPVDDFEFATRLSYFLWGSLPDAELLQLAGRGRLVNSPAAIREQVKRMLEDPRADVLAETFGGGWLGYTSLRSHVADPNTYPEFDDELRQSLLTETGLYLTAFFKENWSISELIDSKTMFLNERVARHYGIGTVKGSQFRRIELGLDERHGLLTQGSILTVTSNPNRTSVVQRGVWILHNVLCESVGDPPPDVPALSEVAKANPQMTLRQQMEAHRSNPACASCHRRMDPLGFGLENYNGVGLWRSAEGSAPIDSSGTISTASGPRSFRNSTEFLALIKDDDRFPSCVTQKLMTYALGRSLADGEKSTTQDIIARTRANHYRIHDIITEIVLSPHFMKTARN